MEHDSDVTAMVEQSSQIYQAHLPPDDEERKARLQEGLNENRTLMQMVLSERYDYLDSYRNLGNTFYKEGKLAWAKHTYQEAITMLKHGIMVGLPDLETGCIVDSMSLGGPARRLDARGREVLYNFHNNLAQCFLKTGEPKKALKELECAANLDHKPALPAVRARLWYRKGEALTAIEEHRGALAAYEKAARLVPKDPATQTALAACRKVNRALDKEELETARLIWSKRLPPAPPPSKA